MKTLLLASTVLVGTTAAAFAADLPRRAAPPPVFVPVPVFTWTGFYAGFNAGYGFGTQDNRAPTVIAVAPSTAIFSTGNVLQSGVLAFANGKSNEGFVGGGQVGYNYQFTPGSGVVIGVEADAQYADFGSQRNRYGFVTGGAGGVVPGTLIYNPSGLSGLDYFGTVRGRLGYAFDRTLLYATGGFAYGAGGGRDFGLPNRDTDSFKTGYTVGGGVEYALPTNSFLNFFRSSAVTLKVEGLYVNMDDGGRSAGAFAVNAFGRQVRIGDPDVLLVSGSTKRSEAEFAVVRAGINYKFGSY